MRTPHPTPDTCPGANFFLFQRLDLDTLELEKRMVRVCIDFFPPEFPAVTAYFYDPVSWIDMVQLRNDSRCNPRPVTSWRNVVANWLWRRNEARNRMQSTARIVLTGSPSNPISIAQAVSALAKETYAIQIYVQTSGSPGEAPEAITGKEVGFTPEALGTACDAARQAVKSWRSQGFEDLSYEVGSLERKRKAILHARQTLAEVDDLMTARPDKVWML